MPSQKTLDEMLDRELEALQTAAVGRLQRQQEELRAEAENWQRERALKAVSALDPNTDRGQLQIMAGLLAEKRYKELEAMVTTVGTQPPAPPSRSIRQPRYTREQKLCMRMGWGDTTDSGAQVHIVQDGPYVFVFGVKNGEAFTLKDEEHIFPSDQMVTQLRMVCGERTT